MDESLQSGNAKNSPAYVLTPPMAVSNGLILITTGPKASIYEYRPVHLLSSTDIRWR